MGYRVYDLYTRSIEHLANIELQTQDETDKSIIPTTHEHTSIHVKFAIIWSHHLLATSKRKDIIEWSDELGLWGISKPGYPGVIIVEGLEEYVDQFLKRIKSLNWQALSVRHEEVRQFHCAEGEWTQHAQLKRTGEKIGVVEVEHISEITKMVEGVDGLSETILSALRIQKTN